MPGDQRVRNLAVAQAALGLVAAALASVELPDPIGLRLVLPPSGLGHILIVPLFASALCQALLLAVWAVASRISVWMRLAGLVAGAAYLEALFSPSVGGEFLGIATVAIAVTTASLLVVRARGFRFCSQADPGQSARHEAEGLRFSIGDLMALIAAVAVLSAGARALRETQGRFLLPAAVWALCFVAVGLVSLWAAMGEARPKQRGPVVFALSPALGAFFAYAAGAHAAGRVYIILTMLLYPTLLLGSLLVVRSCGYRLVRRAVPSSDPSDGGSGPLALGNPASGVTSPE